MDRLAARCSDLSTFFPGALAVNSHRRCDIGLCTLVLSVGLPWSALVAIPLTTGATNRVAPAVASEEHLAWSPEAAAAGHRNGEETRHPADITPAAESPSARAPWLRFLLEALAHPAMGFLLLLVGFSALYCELQVPGIGVAGFVATICLVLFFWNRFLGGTVQWLDIVLLLTGIACLALEFLVIPGFGIFGAGGIVLVAVSLVLANQTFVVPTSGAQFRQLVYSICIVFGALLGTVLVIAAAGHRLAKCPVLNRVFLAPLGSEEMESIRHREMLADWSHLLGAKGQTVTPLKPSGKVQFADQLVDVLAQGEMIPAGVEVIVVEARGNRVVVARAEEATENDQKQGPAA